MAQRGWNRWNGYVLAAAVLGSAACGSSAPTFDLLVKGGQVIDGRGTPRTRADIGVNGDRIVALGDLSAASATTVIDATGRIVSPGFIDVQGQSSTATARAICARASRARSSARATRRPSGQPRPRAPRR